MKNPAMTYLETLFDAINGGDDCDAAAEAQEIAEELLAALKEAHQNEILNDHQGDDPKSCSYCQLIDRAEGKGAKKD